MGGNPHTIKYTQTGCIMPETITENKEALDSVTIEPGKYRVVFYNDDSTPMEFVMAVLMKIFKHSSETAHTLTMKIHNEGNAVAGVYTFEIAEQKGKETVDIARSNGFPLVVKVESE